MKFLKSIFNLRRLIISLIIVSVFSAVFTGFFIYLRSAYLRAYSPIGSPIYVDTCRGSEEKVNYPKVDIATVLRDEMYIDVIKSVKYDWFNSVSGWMAFYPESKNFLLRDGLDYLTVDLSSCQDMEIYKEWPSFYAKIDGKMVFDASGPKLIVRRISSVAPELFESVIKFGSIASVGALLLAGLIAGLAKAIRQSKKSKNINLPWPK